MSTQISTNLYLGQCSFFRGSLLTLDSDGITKLVDNLDKEAKQVRQEVLKMCWYMRGGVPYNDAMNLSFSEREIISTLINENLETTKKSGLPFF